MIIRDPAAAAFPSRRAASSSSCGFKRGQLVRSLAGRDKGRYYLVLARADEKTLIVADGRKRKTASAKRKNIRHLQFSHQVAADLAKKAENDPVSDEEIRAALAEILATTD